MKTGVNLLLSIVFVAGIVKAGEGQNHGGGGGGGGHHKHHRSAEQVAAVKKCNDDYRAALKEAKGKKGKERADAMHQAKAEHKQCIAAAPK